jgi:hypothetical protein
MDITKTDSRGTATHLQESRPRPATKARRPHCKQLPEMSHLSCSQQRYALQATAIRTERETHIMVTIRSDGRGGWYRQRQARTLCKTRSFTTTTRRENDIEIGRPEWHPDEDQLSTADQQANVLCISTINQIGLGSSAKTRKPGVPETPDNRTPNLAALTGTFGLAVIGLSTFALSSFQTGMLVLLCAVQISEIQSGNSSGPPDDHSLLYFGAMAIGSCATLLPGISSLYAAAALWWNPSGQATRLWILIAIGGTAGWAVPGIALGASALTNGEWLAIIIPLYAAPVGVVIPIGLIALLGAAPDQESD